MNLSRKKLLFTSFLSISILSLLSILNTVDLDHIGLTAQVGDTSVIYYDYGSNYPMSFCPSECYQSGFCWNEPDTGQLACMCECFYDRYDVHFRAGTGGTVEGLAAQGVEEGGSSSAVTAVPNSGYTFTNWTGDIEPTTANPLTVSGVTSDVFVTANFTPNPSTYTVSFNEGTGGTVEGTASQEVEEGGISSAVTAVPDSGYTFTNWTGDIATTTANPLTIGNVTEDISVTANFTPNPITYAVSFNAGTGGTVEGTASQEVEEGGSSSAVTAVPDSGYTFTNWTGDIATTTSNPLTIGNVTEDISVTANFTPNPITYAVSFNAGTGGTVEGTASQEVEEGGSSSAVTAVPDSGYTFTNWTGDIATTTSNPLTVSGVTEDISMTANFIQQLPDLVISDLTASTVVNDGTTVEDTLFNTDNKIDLGFTVTNDGQGEVDQNFTIKADLINESGVIVKTSTIQGPPSEYTITSFITAREIERGDYQIEVTIDSGSQIYEESESNNSETIDIQLNEVVEVGFVFIEGHEAYSSPYSNRFINISENVTSPLITSYIEDNNLLEDYNLELNVSFIKADTQYVDIPIIGNIPTINRTGHEFRDNINEYIQTTQESNPDRKIRIVAAGHSAGAIALWRFRDEINIPETDFEIRYLFFDPPYNQDWSKLRLNWQSLAGSGWGSLLYNDIRHMFIARQQGIADYNIPNEGKIIEWTGGYPNSGDGRQILHTQFRNDGSVLIPIWTFMKSMLDDLL